MKKKLFVFLLSIISVVCFAVGLSACENSNSNDDSGNTKQNQTNEENSGSSDSATLHTHSLIHFDASPATCTADGNIEYWICSDCGKYFSDENGLTEITQSDTVITKISHTKGEVVIENEAVATCGTDGYYYNVVYCSVCGKILSNEKITIPATGNHTMTHYAAVDSTCTQEGNIEYWQCSVCNNFYSDENATTEITQATTIITKKAHTLETDEAIEATCTKTGLTEGSHCSVCGEIMVAQEVTDKLEHTPTEAIKENEIVATCVDDGSYDSIIYCSVCNTEISRKTIVISATGVHTYDDDGICTICGKTPSEGLAFTLSSNKQYYIVSGVGNCTETDIAIPSTYNNLPVKEIAASAFCNNTTITNVYIPDSVTTIGASAFAYCVRLTNLTLSNGVETICDEAFYNCAMLKSVNIPESVTSIKYAAFRYCSSLTAVYITDIEAWCNITFGLSASPLYYAGNLYLNGNLVTELVVPNEVTSIKDYAFYGCSSLISVDLPSSLTTIDRSAFDTCTALTAIKIPENVTDIGAYAFRGCTSLKDVNLSNKLVHIGSYAFYACSSLESIVIPDNVTAIGYSVFADCTSLKEVIWGKNLTTTGDCAFENCTSLISIQFGDILTTINYYAFCYCSSLASIVIPKSVISVGSAAFVLCNSLTMVFYCGTEEEWNSISFGSSNSDPTSYGATLYYYSDTKPTDSGNYWHYNENDEITVW